MKDKLIKEILKLGSPEKALLASRFFKTKKGDYGEGDKFAGVAVPVIRKLIRPYVDIKLEELKFLLLNPWHEIRLAGALILVSKYQNTISQEEKKRLVTFYLKHRKAFNNWDLVDQTAYKIIGDFYFQIDETKILNKMIQSSWHWDRRIAMVATLAFIKKQKLKIVTDFAKKVFKDEEDLMHKAAGWMLREMGKKDQKSLLDFIQQHGKQMPRTMLRYAIEKFSSKQRKLLLIQTRS